MFNNVNQHSAADTGYWFDNTLLDAYVEPSSVPTPAVQYPNPPCFYNALE